MVKNTLLNIGVLTVLLLSFAVVNAAVEGVSINIKTGLPNPVIPGHSYNVEVTVENNNGTKILLEWVNTSSSFNTVWTLLEDNSTMINGASADFSATLSIPLGYTGSHSRYLKANVYNDNTGELLGTIQKSFTANSTVPEETILGCTDPDANNYDPDATEDDGSCTYNSLPSNYKYCNDFSGEKGHLEITSFDVMNNGKGDDTEWEYLDEIEIEVAIENTGNDNINNVVVEMKIVDENNNTITKRKMNLNDDTIDLGRINDGDEEIVIFKITEVPIDLESGDYKIYVRAYDDRNPEIECASTSGDFTNDDETYFEFSVIPNDGASIIVKDNLPNVQASCGDKDVEIRFMVYNTGGNDEDKVLVMLENSKLGISEKYVIDNLRNQKGKEAVFYITIPDKVDKSFAELNIYTYYDYDDSEDELDELKAYDDSSEEQGDSFSIGLEILSCQVPIQATIGINLESETTIEKQVIIKATITNNGEDNNFVISTSGLESWAESTTISPLTASIKKGESTDVTITFVPTATGEHTFKINAISNGQTVSQSAVINIKDKPTILSGISNTTLYLITGIIIVLILIFLALIVRVSRRQVKPQF
ncbi:MAG: putative S-layer protein [archaeon]